MPVATEAGRQEHMRRLLAGLTAVRGGDFSTRLPAGRDPLMNEIADAFNAMAGTLAGQVRAISEVTRAVAAGDLTTMVSVEAAGEAAGLKDNVNTMVRSLRATAEASERQGWLRANVARIAGLVRGQRDLAAAAELIMDELIPLVGGQLGAFFVAGQGDGEPGLRLVAGYGLPRGGSQPGQVLLGESLVGQVARTRKPIVLTEVPAGYARVASAIGESRPVNVMIVPVMFEDQVLGVIEAGSLWPFTQAHRALLEQLAETIGVTVNTMIANARADALLERSQRLTAELQARQTELQRSNAELADKAALLAARSRDIEAKNAEIELARQETEERARQLDQASRCKSRFLASMSHELRTPLNSLLVLARLLAQNPVGNLTPKQVEYATVIHSSGSDLLQLINDILDLTNVEAGKTDVSRERFALAQLTEDLRGVFGPLTEDKQLGLTITTSPDVPDDLVTDKQRLRQILYNLLSNAVKFTERGHVELLVETAAAQGPGEPPWIVFSVTDTGIGISPDNLTGIFSAFQQADVTAGRRYGGVGLGLTICREVASLLGGEVSVRSELGRGSTFSLRLPLVRHGGPHTRPSAGEHVRPVPAAMPHEALRGHKVLVVDDDPRNAFVLTDVLEMHGMTVVQAAGGSKAISELAGGDVDLVLMDVRMPRADGYETIRAIRRMPQYARLPVITVTARAMQGGHEKSIEAGATDYITKPVDIEELLGCLERWLT